MNRRTARIAERHRVRYPVVIRGVLEFRRIHAQSAGDREIGTGLPFILHVCASVQNIERLDRLRLPWDVRVAILKLSQRDRRRCACRIREEAVGGGVEVRQRIEDVNALRAGEEHVRRVILLHAHPERHRMFREIERKVVLQLIAMVEQLVLRRKRLEPECGVALAALKNLNFREVRPVDILPALVAGVVSEDQVVGLVPQRRVPFADDRAQVFQNGVIRVREVQGIQTGPAVPEPERVRV